MSDWRSLRDARLKRLRTALARIYEDDAACAVAGALVDLRHICDAQGLSFAERDREAHGQYLAERAAASAPPSESAGMESASRQA